MKITLETMGRFCDIIEIAQEIHENAVPLKTFDYSKSYKISALQIEVLGNALQKLGKEILIQNEFENISET